MAIDFDKIQKKFTEKSCLIGIHFCLDMVK